MRRLLAGPQAVGVGPQHLVAQAACPGERGSARHQRWRRSRASGSRARRGGVQPARSRGLSGKVTGSGCARAKPIAGAPVDFTRSEAGSLRHPSERGPSAASPDPPVKTAQVDLGPPFAQPSQHVQAHRVGRCVRRWCFMASRGPSGPVGRVAVCHCLIGRPRESNPAGPASNQAVVGRFPASLNTDRGLSRATPSTSTSTSSS